MSEPLTAAEIASLPRLTELPHGALLPFGFDRIIATIDSQQRSLDRVAALCDEAATITTGRTEMQMWGVVEVRRLVGVLGNIRAALEAQPSPEVSES
jgi:hypothetical protein